MNLEQTLTDELQAVAGTLPAPPPPTVAALVQAAGEARTRSRVRLAATTVLAAAAVIAAIVAGTQLDRPSSAPPVSRTPSTGPSATPGAYPTGAGPRIPYLLDQTLHLDGSVQAGTWLEVVSAGRSTVGFRLNNGPDATPVVFRDGVEVATLDHTRGTAQLSPDGSKLAWFEASGSTAYLVVRDLVDGRDLGRLSLDHDTIRVASENGSLVASVADDGTVVYSLKNAYHSWKPGGAPVTVATPDDETAPAGFPKDAKYVKLNPDRTWGVWVTDRLGHNPESPDSSGTADGATFQKRDDPNSRFTVTIPDQGSFYEIAWESATDALITYLIDGQGSTEHYFRCHVVTRRCELAPVS